MEKYLVQSQVDSGYLVHHCPDSAPYSPEPLESILKEVSDSIIPDLTHWQSPNFFGYFQANASTAGFLGEMLCTGLNVVGFNWIASPTAIELESIVMDWVGKMLMLPPSFLFSGGGGGVLNGVELSHSISMNPHKWLLTNMDCCCLWIKEPHLFVDSLSTAPEYLRNNASKSKMVIDYKDWQIALSRRFRAIKVWVVIRRHGLHNLMFHICNDVKLAKRFVAHAAKDPIFEVVVPRRFALVCFRLRPKQEGEGT